MLIHKVNILTWFTRKFGKYLESRQLELPEYIGHFINYKALKKLIKSLGIPENNNDLDIERTLQENKTSFFFRLERELEKINSFYLEKESDLKIRLDILIKKKNNAISKNRLGSKKSIAYITLYDGFKRFTRDLDRLQQFVELNQTGFSKVLKKWDKRSKSHTKELYLSKAVSVQPVFNRFEISQLSDLCVNSLVELDSQAEGDYNNNGGAERNNSIHEFKSLQLDQSADIQNNTIDKPQVTIIDDSEIDELYSEFTNLAFSSNFDSLLIEFLNRIKSSPQANFKLTKIFFLSINTKIEDDQLKKFYEAAPNSINLNIIDELTSRSIIHESCCNLTNSRLFIVELGIQHKINLISKDISGRTPLHYASELGRSDIIKILCSNNQVLSHLNSLDYDAMSPLLLAIDKNHLETIKILMEFGANPAPHNTEQNPQYLPLNIACKSGNYEAAMLLLSKPQVKKYQKDAEGLLPLHVVAKTGNYELVPLLTQNDADPNALDGFNKWTPIMYSVSEGHSKTTAALIKAGALIDLKDEDNLTPLFYAIWEGHVNVLNVLINEFKDSKNITPLKVIPSPYIQPSLSITPEVLNIDTIPDLSLPPPIIPLRRYGHNFLEKKIFVQLQFALGRDSIILNQDEVISSLPGRIVITSKISDVVPRNILLPVTDLEQTVAFQIDSLDAFQIDFEIFPSFGTKLIAKTTGLSDVFIKVSNDGLNNLAVLPLFDGRLKNVGELRFSFKVIHPYSGTPLEISKYDTYWKSTSGNGTNTNATSSMTNSVLSFVTASSLSGDYAKVNVSMLSDGTPIVCPSWDLEVQGTKISLFNLSQNQFKKITNYNVDFFKDLSISNINEFLSQNYIFLVDFLRILPDFLNLNLEVLYPTESEIKEIPITLPKTTNLDKFVDLILTSIFNHVREIRSSFEKKSRSLVFSSNNQSVCSILNWKQPNYPVFFNVSGINYLDGQFIQNSANGFPLDIVKNEDFTTRSIKEATRFATLNNLLGIMVPSELLVLIPNLVESIRSRGLILVASKQGFKNHEIGNNDGNDTLIKNDINGARYQDVLTFKGDIDM
ncbi:Ankyrin repeat protein nuc-2 [Wickerhamomyces ciferrii]|uniref:Ankyrin repeat protein nuc-2 n=1 Tax=Wickerhamomyces ciferrii (strain ATCC 14091 / BCRC 22168 / CBS 111 / JCM 3599 / NBRC 0793 / NRRL Y-1031 F-60-10) TaxID=1206466 RepID=K0KMC6_WICCF|nr:Ankyrin repeat protein nuc-2 [Wickerhamomyces ciferrii]CCH43347.1 Ankyrin repeat protein nuc-2 [Wickerhamomyces ciferrii]